MTSQAVHPSNLRPEASPFVMPSIQQQDQPVVKQQLPDIQASWEIVGRPEVVKNSPIDLVWRRAWAALTVKEKNDLILELKCVTHYQTSALYKDPPPGFTREHFDTQQPYFCPVCDWDIFTEYYVINGCGQFLHRNCMRELLRLNQFTCPSCDKEIFSSRELVEEKPSNLTLPHHLVVPVSRELVYPTTNNSSFVYMVFTNTAQAPGKTKCAGDGWEEVNKSELAGISAQVEREALAKDEKMASRWFGFGFGK